LAEGRIPEVPLRWITPNQAADRLLSKGTILIEGYGIMHIMSTTALVWFKRDLRTADHAPLAEAAHCDAALALYIVEPDWIASPECDAQHVQFARDGVLALRAALAKRGLPLIVRAGEAVRVLDLLWHQLPFTHLFSHEETGPGWSDARDRAVAAWCRARGVVWREWPQNGVVRRLKSRDGWAARWQQRMDAPRISTPARFRAAAALPLGDFPSLAALRLPASRPTPAAGERAARAVLEDFLQHRGDGYRFNLSSPARAEHGCSRLSPYLAFGMIGMRQVHQATRARIAALRAMGDAHARNFARHLEAFAARLRWHCHFMQKLEDEPQIEYHNFSRAYDGLREAEFDRARFDAWREGFTGYPMVDACMRRLNATGWLNFRMRAMLVSFAAYHLWLHWREPGLHLARQFLDFEPGIHWSQMQMQSGTTGINALRIYSPLKQQRDHDPDCVFIRRWVPEWGTRDYPPPIVDERAALWQAKTRITAIRHSAAAREQAQAVQQRHGSRKSGLPASGGPSHRRRAAQGQLELFR
jgi:deoxyribodipyrimidine photo-lyase